MAGLFFLLKAGILLLRQFPSNLNARPLVIPDHLKIDIKVNSREPDFLLSTASQITSLSTEYTLSIHKAKHEVSLVELRDDRFVKTLREALWEKTKEINNK